jgi:hypothetical protein
MSVIRLYLHLRTLLFRAIYRLAGRDPDANTP